MIKMYCDRCGEEVNNLNSWEVLIQIRDWGDESPLEQDRRLQYCKECVKKIFEVIKKA